MNGKDKQKKCPHKHQEIRLFGGVRKSVCIDCGAKLDSNNGSKNGKKTKNGKKESKTKDSEKTEKMSILKAIQEVVPKSGTFSAKDIIEKIRAKYPDLSFKDISVSLHLHALDISNEKAKTSNPSLAKNAFLVKVEKGKYQRK